MPTRRKKSSARRAPKKATPAPQARPRARVEPGASRASGASGDTRLALLRTAEQLFAARGVDNVSLREIAAAAGQRNHSAVLYHFEDKRALIDAVLDRHSNAIQAGWLAVVEHMQAEGRDTLPALLSLMTRSLVAKLDDPDGGADYLAVVAQLVTSRSFPLTEMPATMAPGITALTAALMGRIVEIPPHLLALRMMRVAAVLYCSIADYQRLTKAGMEIPRDELVADLVASLVGLCSAHGVR